MVEVDPSIELKEQIRKLNKRILKLRESESELMRIVYGGNVSYSGTLRDIRDEIANLYPVINSINTILAHYL